MTSIAVSSASSTIINQSSRLSARHSSPCLSCPRCRSRLCLLCHGISPILANDLVPESTPTRPPKTAAAELSRDYVVVDLTYSPAKLMHARVWPDSPKKLGDTECPYPKTVPRMISSVPPHQVFVKRLRAFRLMGPKAIGQSKQNILSPQPRQFSARTLRQNMERVGRPETWQETSLAKSYIDVLSLPECTA